MSQPQISVLKPRPRAEEHHQRRNLLHRGYISYLFTALWTFGLAVLVLGPELVLANTTELLSMKGDGAVGLAGFRYFVQDDWHYPLLETSDLRYPEGTVIAFTDSIPILALIAKVLRPLGIGAETWWGAWFAAVFVAQGLATVFTLRAWRITSVVSHLSAATLLCLFPPLLLRIFHPALMFQAPLIVAVGIVGLARSDLSDRRLVTIASLVPVAALLIHPYHVVGVSAMVLGGILDAARMGRRPGRVVVAWLVSTAALLGMALLVFGYVAGIGATAEGYGVYALIPYSFFWPQHSRIWPGADRTLLTGGSFEGFAFLGAGGVLLVVFAAAANLRRLPSLVRRHGSLVGALTLIAAFAITHRLHIDPSDPVDFGAFTLRFINQAERAVVIISGIVFVSTAAALIFRFRRLTTFTEYVHSPIVQLLFVVNGASLVLVLRPTAVETVTGTFRASGRLAWSIGYAMLLASIILIHRRLPAAAAVAALIVVAGVQYYDQHELRTFSRDLYTLDVNREAKLVSLAAVAEAHDVVHLVPDFECVTFGKPLDEFVDVVVASSMAGTPVDNTYAARQKSRSCDRALGQFDDANLVVALEADDPPAAWGSCRSWGEYVSVCSHHWDEIPPATLAFFAGSAGG